MDAERLFIENLPLVERIVAATCRRHRLTREEAEDFGSVVKLKLIADDYATLRQFAGRCSLAGYLATVIQRAYSDHCNHLWGKWRPSAEARRLGPLAVRLDTLLHRDGLTLAEACARAAPEDRAEMERLATRLPSRIRRRIDGEERLAQTPAREASPEAEMIEHEGERTLAGVERALAEALERLAAEDRLLLQLRFYEGVTLASAARALGCDARQLYRRWEALRRELRQALERGGHDALEVAAALRDSSGGGGGGAHLRPSL